MKIYLLRIKSIILRLLLGRFYNESFFSAERKVAKKIPAIKSRFSYIKRLKCFLSGFNSDKLVWYDWNAYRKEDYISDLVHFRDFEKIDWKYYYIAHNKLVCERFFSNFCKVIPTIGYIEQGYYYPIGKNVRFFSIDKLIEAVHSGECFYLKPYDGGSGRGIGRICFRNGNYLWNADVVPDLKSYLKSLSGYLIQKEFVQKGFSHEVNPSTLNTLRVFTMLLPSTRKAFVACAVHRFGRENTFVDNIAKEGLLCPINIETGEIEYAVIYPTDAELKKVTSHPDTGIKIAGVKIPNWKQVVNMCEDLALQIPFMPLCGWDIVLSGDDIYVQELNYNPDIYLGQISKPLLLDERVKEFYDYYVERG